MNSAINPQSTPPPVDKSPARVRRMFGEIAGRYDALNRVLSLGIDRLWRRKTVRLVPPRGGLPILDICTGTADLALAYWRASREDTPIFASDFCRPMLSRGREKLYRAGADHRVRLVEADALRLPFRDGAFQIVSVAFGLRNLSDTDAGLREMARVCHPTGRVAILEFSHPRGRVLGTLYGFYFGQILPRIGQAVARNQHGAYHYLPASVGQFPQGEALCERIRAAGFARATCHPLSFGIVSLYVGERGIGD